MAQSVGMADALGAGVALLLVVWLLRFAWRATGRRRALETLAGWSVPATELAGEVERDVLGLARELFGAPRALLLWEEDEEPWRRLAVSSERGLELESVAPDAFEPAVDAALADATFRLRRKGAGRSVTHVRGSDGRTTRWHGSALHPELDRRLGPQDVLSSALRGEGVSGRLCIVVPRRVGDAELALAELLGRRAGARLAALERGRRLASVAGEQERQRFTRELHDGVVQVLAAAVLRLENVQRQLAPATPLWRELAELGQLLASEEDELRALVLRRSGGTQPTPGAPVSALARLQDVARRLERYWGLRVALRCDPATEGLAAELAHEIGRLAHEALVNAARHGRATSATVGLTLDGKEVGLEIADDGVGFPFGGRFEWEQLTALELGPVMLKQRIAALGGELAIDSSASGARLEIRLPRSREVS